MTELGKRSGGDIFIVDNSDEDWKVVRYLYEWAELTRALDIATGYFEIGALLALDTRWQKIDQIRLLMGDEVSKRTWQAFEASVREIALKLDQSIEDAKADDDFLSGVPAIVAAFRSGQIQARVYRKRKFHAKAYITHARLDVIGSVALVGSSNFTFPGLHQNIELNIQIRREVAALQAWYERHWDEAEDVTPEMLRIIERHTHEYTPFDVYTRALNAFFRGRELSVGEWEQSGSAIYPILDQYQREGYHALMRIAQRYNGALLCDGVGLGKTFIGLMLIERLLFERKRVALIVPKAARTDVWEAKLRRYLPSVRGHFSNLAIYNHTDLLRGGAYPELIQEIAEKVDAIVIDEAHHFRNNASDRARKLFEITVDKQLFLLTATPINNSLYDLMHLIEYFSRRTPNYFSDAPLGIHTLRGHFRKMEEALNTLTSNRSDIAIDALAAEQLLAGDTLFQALVVQRSRAYVRRSLENQGGQPVAFPRREDPQVAAYSLRKTYGVLLTRIAAAFDKQQPLLTLPIYVPLAYTRGRGDVDPFDEGRQHQVVGLIRSLLLKRFESSVVAFRASCADLLRKLLYFVELHAPRYAKEWRKRHAPTMAQIDRHLRERGLTDAREEDLEEDALDDLFKTNIERISEREYQIIDMLDDAKLDLEQLARFLEELAGFEPAHDDKLQTLIRLMCDHRHLSRRKVLIFTEYRDTARYIAAELQAAGVGPLAAIDSQSTLSVSDAVQAFAPYYNESSSADLAAAGIDEIRVLVATDILAEGLNLQDATCIINYDLHWNPVRLMQRIGRVDRRLDASAEARIVADHPDAAVARGVVQLWNFLPPDELNEILSLYERVAHKTLRISKTFGIEGRKLLTPQDDYNALRDFNEAYEGTTTSTEEMYLAYQQLLREDPDLPARAEGLPLRIFSGKQRPADAARAVFFCYRLPARDAATGAWEQESSFTRWYLYDLADGRIEQDATRIFPLIQSRPNTPRHTETAPATLSEIRHVLDLHIANTYLKQVQAPVGIAPQLLAWMELT